MLVTALAGGIGGAKLLVGLQAALPPGNLVAIVNTADDDTIYNVHVAPDVDIVTYWLAGRADRSRGWGLEGDSFAMVEALERLGAESWFRLGDADLATCIFRTTRMAQGATLSSVADEIRRALGVATRVLPMTDNRVRTLVDCADGRTLSFQEYFVRERTRPEVASVRYDGCADSKPAPGVLEAIDAADAVVVCPSNPVLSVAPILGLAGVRDALAAHPSVIAVTPIVAGAALKGPADRLLVSLGGSASAAGVARLYADFCDVFVVDASDPGELETISALGMRAEAADTIMSDQDASERLARFLLAL
ncbi:MAG: 2-phospho-L-lactate transferase [Actinomycetota bacterium]